MKIVRTTIKGISYLRGLLKEKARVITRVSLWSIPHSTPETEDVCLKIGRYNKDDDWSPETLEVKNPKSELTLDSEEFAALIDFLSENHEPFKKGIRQYIPLSETLNIKNLEHIKGLFSDPDKGSVIDFIAANDILEEDLLMGLEMKKRGDALIEFEKMLEENLLEARWQAWFKRNSWVLGSDFVRIIDERQIDTENISDYLTQAYDGFLDIIEIKRPGGDLGFWAATLDHGNYVPSSDLVKAITQATTYIHEVEREASTLKFFERVGHIKAIKPRCVLIFGRSQDWSVEQREAYRILNASYHNLSILTYDHVLDRARRILKTSDGK